MARFGTSGAVYLQVFVLCASVSSLVDSLNLPQNAQKATLRPRPKPTKETSGSLPISSTEPPTDDSGVAIYRLINRDTDKTCILLKTDALVEVRYKLHNLDEQADSFIPDAALVQGSCDNEDVVKMSLGWPGYSLLLTFSKTPGGEHWYLSYVELIVSVDGIKLHSIRTRDKTIRLYKMNNKMYLPTPVGKSYQCEEVAIPLETDPADHPPKDIHGSLMFRKLQVQAFMYRSENFSTPFECKSQTSFRSETAPIAVGSTLAIAALATVTGYGVFRYFKVNNVQYNTME